MRFDPTLPRCYHCGRTFGSNEPWKGKDGKLYCDWHCEKACAEGDDEGHRYIPQLRKFSN